MGKALPVSVRLVDWADEEGARFGHSLLGSSAVSGALDVEQAAELRDRDGVRLADALRDHDVDIYHAKTAGKELTNVAAALELHIEQGPVLEKLDSAIGRSHQHFWCRTSQYSICRSSSPRRFNADGSAA